MAVEQFSNAAQTTLNGAITAGATSITVTSSTGFPTSPQFRIIIDTEIMLVTAVSGNVWTVTRAYESVGGSQVAAAHNNNATVTHDLTAGSLLNIGSSVAAGSIPLSAVSGRAGTFESVRYADLFGGASVGAQIDAAASDLSGARGLVFIPSSLGAGTWSTLPPNASFLDLRNTAGVTNTAQISPFKLNSRVDVGSNNLSLGMFELQATGGTWGGAGIGENVALYAGVVRTSGSRGVWATNFLVTSTVAPSTSPTYGLEIDVNNNSGTAATGNNIFDGLAVLSGGTTNARNAILIGISPVTAGKWYDGIVITNAIADAGIVVNAGIPTGLRLQSPLQVSGMNNNSAQFTPGIDNASAEIYGTNAANSVVVWQINNDGSTAWKSATFSLVGDAVGINPARATGTGAALAIYGTVAGNDARLKGNNDGSLHTSGALIIEAGGLTVSAGGATITGNSAISGLLKMTTAQITGDPGAGSAGELRLTYTTGLGNGAATNMQAAAIGTGSGPSSLSVAQWVKVWDGITTRWMPLFS